MDSPVAHPPNFLPELIHPHVSPIALKAFRHRVDSLKGSNGVCANERGLFNVESLMNTK